MGYLRRYAIDNGTPRRVYQKDNSQKSDQGAGEIICFYNHGFLN